MILRDVIRYYELTGCDFQTDLKNFSKLQREFYNDIVADNFTDQYEAFTDKLFILWTDRQGGVKNVLDNELELPTMDELIELYCRVIDPSNLPEEEKETTTVFMQDSFLRKKAKKEKSENQTLELIATLTNIEIDISQFLDMELEVVYSIISIVGEKKKEEEKKRKQKRKGR